jgi:hypothetical protein
MPQGCPGGRGASRGPGLGGIWSRHDARQAIMRSSSRRSAPDGDKRARIPEDPEVLQMRQFDRGKNIFRTLRPMAAV